MANIANCLAAPRWMRCLLVTAGLYNVLWGLSVIFFPNAWFTLFDMVAPRYPWIWQCVGMIVGVYGLGYWIAAGNPLRHWPIVLVGFVGKVLGPIGFVAAALQGALPWEWGLLILTNDVVWWVPFAMMLYAAWWHGSDTAQIAGALSWGQALSECRSHRGASLLELSQQKPTLVVFLRHSGCTFCRLVLRDLGRQRRALAARKIQLAIVHMSDPMTGRLWCEKYELDDVHRFSDPHCQLYRAFGLPRASLKQLLALRVWRQGFWAAIWEGHGFGWQDGDGFRLSGAFLMSDGRVEAEYRCKTPADRLDFIAFAEGACEWADRGLTANAESRGATASA